MITQLTPNSRKALSALLTLLMLWLPTAAQQTTPAPAPVYVLTPSDVQAGKISRLMLKLRDESALVSASAPDIEVKPDDPSALTVIGQTLKADKKTLMITIEVPQASFGQTSLSVTSGNKANATMSEVDGVYLTVTKFQQKPLDPGPTPNGITRVDAMWTLLPDSVVKDNYGKSTAKSYYGIQVVLGNNSGFDMEVVGMGFVTRLWPGAAGHHAAAGAPEYYDESCIEPEAPNAAKPEDRAKPEDAPKPDKEHAPVFKRGCVQIPAIDHRLVRGTIEKEQAFGTRALSLGLLTGVGTLSTGFLPFFHALNPKANFSTLTSVLNGQFKEGFNLAVPDLTVRQLNRLENQVMHDSLTISNNRQERTVVFVPKGIFDRLDETGKKLKEKLMPADVIRRLGELILVGHPLLYYEDRQIVVAKTERANPATGFTAQPQTPPGTPANAAATPPTPPLLSVAPNSGALDETHEVIITGTGFVPNTHPMVIFGNTQTIGEALSATTIKATPPAGTTVGPVDVTVAISATQQPKLPGGYTYLDKLEVLAVEPQTAPAGTTVLIRGHGFMNNAQVLIGGVAAPLLSVAPDRSFITIMLPAHAPGLVSITVTNPNSKVMTRPDVFTYP